MPLTKFGEQTLHCINSKTSDRQQHQSSHASIENMTFAYKLFSVPGLMRGDVDVHHNAIKFKSNSAICFELGLNQAK